MIGTSLGQLFEDKMSMHLGLDMNVDPNMVVTPNQVDQNEKDQQQDYNDPNLGGVDT